MPTEVEVAANAAIAIYRWLRTQGAPKSATFLLQLGRAVGVSEPAIRFAWHRSEDSSVPAVRNRPVASGGENLKPLEIPIEEEPLPPHRQPLLRTVPPGVSYRRGEDGQLYACMTVLGEPCGECARCGGPIYPRTRAGIGRRKWCVFCRYLI